MKHRPRSSAAPNGEWQDELGSIWRELRSTAPPFLIDSLFAPAMDSLTGALRIKVKLIGTASKKPLARREADVAILIEDIAHEPKFASAQIEAERIGILRYAVYCALGRDLDVLPWSLGVA